VCSLVCVDGDLDTTTSNRQQLRKIARVCVVRSFCVYVPVRRPWFGEKKSEREGKHLWSFFLAGSLRPFLYSRHPASAEQYVLFYPWEGGNQRARERKDKGRERTRERESKCVCINDKTLSSSKGAAWTHTILKKITKERRGRTTVDGDEQPAVRSFLVCVAVLAFLFDTAGPSRRALRVGCLEASSVNTHTLTMKSMREGLLWQAACSDTAAFLCTLTNQKHVPFRSFKPARLLNTRLRSSPPQCMHGPPMTAARILKPSIGQFLIGQTSLQTRNRFGVIQWPMACCSRPIFFNRGPWIARGALALLVETEQRLRTKQ